MGGTSTDISLVSTTARCCLAERARSAVARSRCRRSTSSRSAPAADRSPGATHGGALRVGPRSAGARPGPLVTDTAARKPTVTDANLLLGYLVEHSALAGGLQLDRDAAERALARLARRSGWMRSTTAAGIVEIANLEMLRATTRDDRRAWDRSARPCARRIRRRRTDARRRDRRSRWRSIA